MQNNQELSRMLENSYLNHLVEENENRSLFSIRDLLEMGAQISCSEIKVGKTFNYIKKNETFRLMGWATPDKAYVRIGEKQGNKFVYLGWNQDVDSNIWQKYFTKI